MSELHDAIVDPENVAAAFLEVAESIGRKSKTASLRGIDCVDMRGLETEGSRVVARVREELESRTPCRPAIESKMPKGDGTDRRIFTYSIIDRVKARAIERQLIPDFEARYHTNLYSYRKGRSAHDAVAAVVRRYRKRWTTDFIVRTDIKDYTDNIDHGELGATLQTWIEEADVVDLCRLFVGNGSAKDTSGGMVHERPQRGLIQGVGLIGQFANVYLSEADHDLSRCVRVYRRVGDDIVMMDPDRQRIEMAMGRLEHRCQRLKLSLSASKTFVGPAGHRFECLGYQFHDGVVNVKPSSIDDLIRLYRTRLAWTSSPLAGKVRTFERIWKQNQFELHRKALDLVFTHRLSRDVRQLENCSQELFRVLTRFFFGRYSPANHRRTIKITAPFPIPSLPRLHHLITHGKASYRSLLIP